MQLFARALLLLFSCMASGIPGSAAIFAQAMAPDGASAVHGKELDLDARAPKISAEKLKAIIDGGGRVKLLDIRGPEEFAVSRIAGAERIDEWVDKGELARALAKDGAGTIFVLYCTTQARSQVAADAVLHDLMAAGAEAVYFLDEGLKAWLEAGFTLSGNAGPTRDLHPHDAETDKLLHGAERLRKVQR